MHRNPDPGPRAPILVQNFAPLKTPLKAPLNILAIVLLRKFSKELSKEHLKEQNVAPESGPWVPITMQNFGPLKSPLKTSLTKLLLKYSKDFSNRDPAPTPHAETNGRAERLSVERICGRQCTAQEGNSSF